MYVENDGKLIHIIYIYICDLYESYGYDDHDEALRISITKNHDHEKKKKKKKKKKKHMTTIPRWQNPTEVHGKYTSQD